MTDSSTWSSAFGELTAAGVHVRLYAADAPLYIHAKVIVRDPGAGDQQAFVGSQNFSTESLEYNRELGIVLGSGSVVEQLLAMFRGDDMALRPGRPEQARRSDLIRWSWVRHPGDDPRGTAPAAGRPVRRWRRGRRTPRAPPGSA